MCSIPDPEPGPGEVVIAVAAAGLCGSALEAYHRRLPSSTPLPRVPGHEFSGRIVVAGAGVEGFSDELPLSRWQDGYARSESRQAVKVIFRPQAES
jgi:NADPH:quinone reductase-like Zn-dependent oxidoreductase